MATPDDPFGLTTGYGFQTPPDEEMIQALMGQLQAGNTAKAAQPRLEKQMSQAEALRDRAGPQSTHWLSGLSQLGNKAAGIRDVRATKKQQIAGEQALGNSLAAQQKAQLEAQSRQESSVLANTRLGLANREDDYERDKEAASALAGAKAREKSADRAHEIEIQRMKNVGKKKGTSGVPSRIYTKDGTAHDGDMVEGGFLTVEGEQIPRSEIKTYGERGIDTGVEKARLNQAPHALKMNYEFMDYSPEQWEEVTRPLGNMPHSLVTKFFKESEKQGFSDWVKSLPRRHQKYLPQMTEENQAAVRHSFDVLSRIRTHIVMPYREDNTSGALSDRDVEEFTRNIMLDEGISGEQAYLAAQSLFKKNEAYIRRQVQGYADHGNEEAYYYSQPAMKVLRPEGWQDVRDKAQRDSGIRFGGSPGIPETGGVTREGTNVAVTPEQAGQAGRPSPLPPFDPQQYQDALYMAKIGNADAIRYVETYAEQAGK